MAIFILGLAFVVYLDARNSVAAYQAGPRPLLLFSREKINNMIYYRYENNA